LPIFYHSWRKSAMSGICKQNAARRCQYNKAQFPHSSGQKHCSLVPFKSLKFHKAFEYLWEEQMNFEGKKMLLRHLWIKFVWRDIYRCPGRNVPDFGRMFLKLKYTDITKNTYIRSWTITEIMVREKRGLVAVPCTVHCSRDVLAVHCACPSFILQQLHVKHFWLEMFFSFIFSPFKGLIRKEQWLPLPFYISQQKNLCLQEVLAITQLRQLWGSARHIRTGSEFLFLRSLHHVSFSLVSWSVWSNPLTSGRHRESLKAFVFAYLPTGRLNVECHIITMGFQAENREYMS
jgi:hypothetical protein